MQSSSPPRAPVSTQERLFTNSVQEKPRPSIHKALQPAFRMVAGNLPTGTDV